jgi:hypothetical protein
MRAVLRKTPVPMIVPTTNDMVGTNPSPRTNSRLVMVDVEGGKGQKSVSRE